MRECQRGAVRLRILHHAAEGGIHGAWMTEELGGHGPAQPRGTGASAEAVARDSRASAE